MATVATAGGALVLPPLQTHDEGPSVKPHFGTQSHGLSACCLRFVALVTLTTQDSLLGRVANPLPDGSSSHELLGFSRVYMTSSLPGFLAQASLTRFLERDGFQYEKGHILHKGQVASLPDIQDAVAGFDIPELRRQLHRLRPAVEDDPCLAIGTAKELVETTCKTILEARGISFTSSADLGELVRDTRKALELMPNDVANAAKGAEVVRRLLSNLGTIAQGLAELRNLYGTGHGKGGHSKGLTGRHARLAVGSAATLATFLLETHEARGSED